MARPCDCTLTSLSNIFFAVSIIGLLIQMLLIGLKISDLDEIGGFMNSTYWVGYGWFTLPYTTLTIIITLLMKCKAIPGNCVLTLILLIFPFAFNDVWLAVFISQTERYTTTEPILTIVMIFVNLFYLIFNLVTLCKIGKEGYFKPRICRNLCYYLKSDWEDFHGIKSERPIFMKTNKYSSKEDASTIIACAKNGNYTEDDIVVPDEKSKVTIIIEDKPIEKNKANEKSKNKKEIGGIFFFPTAQNHFQLNLNVFPSLISSLFIVIDNRYPAQRAFFYDTMAYRNLSKIC